MFWKKKKENKMSKYNFTPEMGEISGMGGGYEAHCRKMLKGACEWLEANPNADPQFSGYQNIYGIIKEENEDAKSLSNAIVKAGDNDLTGAMHQAVVTAALFIKKNGWDKYVEAMSKGEAA